jgi:hypothetical protein
VTDLVATSFLSLGEIDRIVAMEDILERNAWITHGYHALSEAVAGLLGRTDANWLSFGQWASAEARRSMTGETVPDVVEPLIGPTIARTVGAANAAVFGDVSRPFIEWATAFHGDAVACRDPERAGVVLRTLMQRPQLTSSEDLRRAFRAYTDALLLRSSSDPDSARRATARMFVANASIGAHEQAVADPYVKAAIPGGSVLAVAATAHMGLHLPQGFLRLDRDVPRPAYLQGPQFPPDLEVLDDPEAIGLARRFGQDLASAADSDAPDWEDYGERMGYIFTLLRSFQQDPSIFGLPPETPAIDDEPSDPTDQRGAARA